MNSPQPQPNRSSTHPRQGHQCQHRRLHKSAARRKDRTLKKCVLPYLHLRWWLARLFDGRKAIDSLADAVKCMAGGTRLRHHSGVVLHPPRSPVWPLARWVQMAASTGAGSSSPVLFRLVRRLRNEPAPFKLPQPFIHAGDLSRRYTRRASCAAAGAVLWDRSE